MNYFDGMISAQLFCALLALPMLGATELLKRKPELHPDAPKLIRKLYMASGVAVIVGVLVPVVVPYARMSGVEAMCPRCGANFDRHIQALAGDTVGFTAAGFFSARMLLILIHLPPSLFRPVHYVLVDKVDLIAPGAEENVETLELLVRSSAILPPLFLGVPLAVASQWIYFWHVNLGDDTLELSRDKAFTFLQISLFFLGPMVVSMLRPRSRPTLWLRYVVYMVLYYSPLVWRLLSESCSLEKPSSGIKPLGWDEAGLLPVVGSWLYCFMLTWIPHDAAGVRALLATVAQILAEIILTTVITTNLLHYVFSELQPAAVREAQARAAQMKRASSGLYASGSKVAPPKIAHPKGYNIKLPETESERAGKKDKVARYTLFGLSVALAVFSLATGISQVFTQDLRCGTQLWCAARPESTNCELIRVDDICARVHWTWNMALALLGIVPVLTAAVGAFAGLAIVNPALLSRFAPAAYAKRVTELGRHARRLWIVLLNVHALGAWVVYLLIDAFADAVCADETARILYAALDATSMFDLADPTYGQEVDPSCAGEIRSVFLGRTWVIFASSIAIAFCVAALSTWVRDQSEAVPAPPVGQTPASSRKSFGGGSSPSDRRLQQPGRADDAAGDPAAAIPAAGPGLRRWSLRAAEMSAAVERTRILGGVE